MAINDDSGEAAVWSRASWIRVSSVGDLRTAYCPVHAFYCAINALRIIPHIVFVISDQTFRLRGTDRRSWSLGLGVVDSGLGRWGRWWHLSGGSIEPSVTPHLRIPVFCYSKRSGHLLRTAWMRIGDHSLQCVVTEY